MTLALYWEEGFCPVSTISWEQFYFSPDIKWIGKDLYFAVPWTGKWVRITEIEEV